MGERRFRNGTSKPGKLKKALRQGVSTVFRLTMGSSHSHNLTPLPLAATEANPDAPSLRFHRVCGDNIQVDPEGFRVRRVESFCKGIVFSDRPVAVGERVCLRLTDLSSRWSGVLRVGFSAHNPGMLTGANLPKYACPDLTSKPGYWAKALSERYSESNVLIHYYVSGNGEVHFGINGQDRGVFFSGVDVRTPLWALIDLCGNCTGLELVDLRINLNNRNRVSDDEAQVRSLNGQMAGMTLQRNMQQQRLLLEQQQHQQQQQQQQQVQQPRQSIQQPAMPPPPPQQQQPPVPPPVPSAPQTSLPVYLPLKHHRHVAFRPTTFHYCTGKHARLSENSVVASRHDEEFAQGYAFTASPIKLGEAIVVQVLATEPSYIGSLAFGLTNCDPSSVDTRELPEDADLLLDRPEYWVVSKDVARSPDIGDELSFLIRSNGSVEFSKNGGPFVAFMHVDASLKLWAFWDVYGNTSRIRLLGTTAGPMNQPSSSVVTAPLVPPTANSTECTVCYERPVDCAIYTCGHMCMCHGCAMQQWKGRGGGFCPICREPIRDVIRTFRA